jgi:hypothetical protein
MEMAANHKAALVHETGMSKEGTLAYKGLVPTEIYVVLEGLIPRFFQTRAYIDKLQKKLLGPHQPALKKVHFIDNRRTDAPAPEACHESQDAD